MKKSDKNGLSSGTTRPSSSSTTVYSRRRVEDANSGRSSQHLPEVQGHEDIATHASCTESPAQGQDTNKLLVVLETIEAVLLLCEADDDGDHACY
jgi:hypothetical protein